MDGSTGGSLVLAMTIIGFAIWLQRNEEHTDQNGSSESELDRVYHRARSASRKRTNRLIGFSGLLILATAFISNPIAWMSIWLLVMISLLIVIGLAGKDAVRTYRYHQKKLDEVRM
ncbi:hypothetical protein [Rubripirellula obstinata]|nr:hypothetical protein [Rubripirellula obstinata]